MKIDIPDLPGNSNMQKAAQTREERRNEDDVTPKRVAVAKGIVRKSSERSTDISETSFIKQDLHTVTEHVIMNIMMPRVQHLIVDLIDGVARGIFLGENVVSTGSRGHTNYQGISSVKNPIRQTSNVAVYQKPRGSNSQFDTVGFETYGEAKLALDALDEIMQDAGVVTVADLYSVADMSCPYTGNYMGWTNLSTARIESDHNGYWINLPKPRQIQNA